MSGHDPRRRREGVAVSSNLGPTLAGAVLSIEAAQRMLPNDPEGAREVLLRAADHVADAIGEVRSLGLPPP